MPNSERSTYFVFRAAEDELFLVQITVYVVIKVVYEIGMFNLCVSLHFNCYYLVNYLCP